MKAWQVAVVVLLLAAAGWAVISYSPGGTSVRHDSSVASTPTPTPTVAQGDVSLLFAGDIMLARSVGDAMARRTDWQWPFALIASVTRESDLTFANLETTVSTRGTQNGCAYCFRADPRSVEGLVFAGVDVVSLANNHTWDYGLPALEDTLNYLAANNISAVGAGRTLEEAREPIVRIVGTTRIAYLAYTNLLPQSALATDVRAGVNLFDAARMTEDIARARTLADVVVVSFHTGTEYEPRHNSDQEHIYRQAIDVGADLVVGHHPHVAQDIEQYKGKWIAYSLGNFVFDQSWSIATQRGLLLDVAIQNGAIVSIATRSIDISSQYQASLHQ